MKRRRDANGFDAPEDFRKIPVDEPPPLPPNLAQEGSSHRQEWSHTASEAIALAETAAGPTGPMFGRYQLVTQIGSGGMAEVFLARKVGVHGFQKVVVIKRIRPEYCRDPSFVSMFLDEARVAAQLDHPHIVQIHDLGLVEGRYFIAMEYLRGQTLRRVIRRQEKTGLYPPFEFGARVMEMALDGLHYAHELRGPDGAHLGLVHRDFTPSNILIGYTGVVKLIDFGIARAKERATETQSGTVKGKTPYLSPEQCHGWPVDRRADIYTAGVVLWELLTGRQLFSEPNEFRIMRRIVDGDTPPPSSVTPVPPGLERIVMRALAVKAEDRYSTAASMCNDLRAFLRGSSTHMETTDISQSMHQLFAAEIAAEAQQIRLVTQSQPAEASLLMGDMSSGSRSYASPSVAPVVSSTPVDVPSPSQKRRSPKLWFAISGGVGLGLLCILALLWVKQPRTGSILVSSVPPGATVYVDGAKAGVTPLALADISVGKPKRIRTNLAGHQPFETTVKVGEPGAIVPVRVALEPLHATQAPLPTAPPAVETDDAAPETQVPPPSQTASTKSTSRRSPPARRSPPPRPQPKERSVDPISGWGRLGLDTLPQTAVYLDAKKLGDTPLVNVKVPAGNIELLLVNEEAGIRKSYTLTIPPGGAVNRRLRL